MLSDSRENRKEDLGKKMWTLQKLKVIQTANG